MIKAEDMTRGWGWNDGSGVGKQVALELEPHNVEISRELRRVRQVRPQRMRHPEPLAS